MDIEFYKYNDVQFYLVQMLYGYLVALGRLFWNIYISAMNYMFYF